MRKQRLVNEACLSNFVNQPSLNTTDVCEVVHRCVFHHLAIRRRVVRHRVVRHRGHYDSGYQNYVVNHRFGSLTGPAGYFRCRVFRHPDRCDSGYYSYEPRCPARFGYLGGPVGLCRLPGSDHSGSCYY